MPEENPKYYAVLTEAGARLEARALVEGRGVVLTHIVVGDANLQDVVPQADVTELVHEVCRRPIEFRSVDKNDPNVTLLHAIIPASIGGFWVRELGVVGRLEAKEPDETDNIEVLYAYANHAPYYKMLPQDGQTVTHEITVPILQSTDARLVIEVSEDGYATKKELDELRHQLGSEAAFVEFADNMVRMSSRIAAIEQGKIMNQSRRPEAGGARRTR